jgi:hypothetical protein
MSAVLEKRFYAAGKSPQTDLRGQDLFSLEMYSARYSELIDPENASVRGLAENVFGANAYEPAFSKDVYFDRSIELLRSFKYRNESGITSLESVAAERAGNCLSLICLLCSLLRCVGFSEKEVFALVGCPKGFHLIRIHAYAVIKRSGWDRFLVIDPEFMYVIEVDPEDWISKNSVFVVFNDKVQASDSEVKCRLLDQPKGSPS